MDPGLVKMLARGAIARCPRCGRGKLFRGWYGTRAACESCGLPFGDPQGSQWGFMYISTAALTGLVIIAFLVLPAPANRKLGRLGVAAVVAVLFFVTQPSRKGIAIALDHAIRRATGD